MISVVYKKSKSAKKYYMTLFVSELTPDRIINANARKPLIPNKYIIEHIGIGESFIDLFKSKYDIKRYDTV